MIQDNQKIKESLIGIYQLLKFTPSEINETFQGITQVQQVAASSELLKSLNEDEIKIMTESVEKSDEEKQGIMEQIAKNHLNDVDLKSRTQAAITGVLEEHIAYLKTRGDDRQKEEISKILAGIE